MAVIEVPRMAPFLRANDNFLDPMGYGAGEVVGQHHRIFCEAGHAVASPGIWRSWASLRSRRFVSGSSAGSPGGWTIWLEAKATRSSTSMARSSGS